MLARNYDPAIGRFLQIDPAMEFASPFTYVGNNPMRLIDPTGMCSAESASRIKTCYNQSETGQGIGNKESDCPEGDCEEDEVENNKKQEGSGLDIVNSLLINPSMGVALLINTNLNNSFTLGGKSYSLGFHGNQYVSKYSVQGAKFNSAGISSFASRLSTRLGYVGIGVTVYDGLANGWQNHHTADVAIAGLLMTTTAVAPPIGITAAAIYYGTDLVTTLVSGRSITEHAFDE